MSRYRDWTNTSDNILNRIINNEGLSASKASEKVKALVTAYAKESNFKGSYTDKVLFVKSRFGHFVRLNKLNKIP